MRFRLLLVLALVCSVAHAAQMTLSWQDNASNELGYRIERAQGASGAFADVGTVGANVTTWVDTGLPNSTLFRYRVRAWNYRTGTEVQFSEYSNIAQATTPAADGNAAPQGTGNTVALRWGDRLVNISTRLPLASDANAPAIAGFVLQGAGRVLIRGVGPTLGTLKGEDGAVLVPDAHPDVRVALFSGSTQTAANDNWGSVQAVADASALVGAFPLVPGSKDAALLVDLPAGSYTVQLFGVSGAGTALVEVYLVP